jgi:integrase
MTLRLKGTAPRQGEVDKRYYMIDVQVGKRRERISSGTRDKDLAHRREIQIVDALRATPLITRDELLTLVRGMDRAKQLIKKQARAAGVSSHTLGSVGDNVWQKVWSSADNARRNLCNFRQVMDYFGRETPVVTIDGERIEEFVTHLKEIEKNAEATVNRKLSVLSVILDYAWRTLRIIPTVPPFPKRGRERKRSLFLEEDGFYEILEAIRKRDERPIYLERGGHPVKRDAHLYLPFFEYLFESGMRPAEAFNIRWEDCDFKRRVVTVRHAEHLGQTTKTDRTRRVPMTERAEAILLALRHSIKSGPFQNITHRRANDHWLGARLSLGIKDKDCVPYATRHSLATRLIEETGDLHQAKEWLGHSTISLTSNTYAHAQTKYLTKGADALNKRRSSLEEECNGT